MERIRRQLAAKGLSGAAYLVRGGSLLILSQMIDLALGLAGLVVLTARVPPQVYGIYGAVIAALSMAAIASLPGMERSIQYEVALGHYGALAAATRIRARSALWGVLGLLVWAGFLAWRGQPLTAWAVAITAPVLPLLYGMSGFRPYLLGKSEFGIYLLLNSITELAKFAFLALGSGHLPMLVLIPGYFALNAMLNALWTIVCVRRAPNREAGNQLGQIGRWLTLAGAIDTAANYADRLVVSAVFSINVMAIYSLATSLTEPLRAVGSALANLVFPKLARRIVRGATAWRQLVFGFVILAAGVGILWVLILFGLRALVPLWFPQYLPALDMLPWLIAATALLAWGTVGLQFLWSRKNLRAMYVIQIALPIVRLVMLSVLALLAGFQGLLWSRVAFGVLADVVVCAVMMMDWLAERREPHHLAPEGASDV